MLENLRGASWPFMSPEDQEVWKAECCVEKLSSPKSMGLDGLDIKLLVTGAFRDQLFVAKRSLIFKFPGIPPI